MSETNRMIVNNQAGISDSAALLFVSEVVAAGKISIKAGEPLYCYATTFPQGIVVYANRTKNGTHTFTISKIF